MKEIRWERQILYDFTHVEYRTNKIKTNSHTQHRSAVTKGESGREKWAKGVNRIAVESKQTCSADRSAVYADALVRQGPKYIVTGLYINSRMFQ